MSDQASCVMMMMASKREIWKDIPGYEGFYQASNLGRIRRNSKEIFRKNGYRIPPKIHIMKRVNTAQGYASVILSMLGVRKQKMSHRLVLMAFSGRDMPGFECNHIDGNKQNNDIRNLEWVTRSENMKHAFRTGLSKIPTNQVSGEKHCKAVLNWSKVNKIREMLSNGAKQREVSELFGIATATVYQVKNGLTWKQK